MIGTECLKTLVECFHQGEEAEHALEDIILIAKESAENRRKLKEGVIPLVIELWQRNVKSRAYLRSEAISTLRCIAIASQENKVHF